MMPARGRTRTSSGPSPGCARPGSSTASSCRATCAWTAPPQGFRLVLRELARYLPTRPAAEEEATAATPAKASAEVTAAAELLAGRTAVLIGGERRTRAEQALCSALRLKELDWVAV